MSDLDSVIAFQWDQGNGRKNEKHRVSQSEAEQAFFDPRLLIAADASHSAGESRCHALGRTIAGRLLHITFTLREQKTYIRIISARPMHRKEKTFYEHQD